MKIQTADVGNAFAPMMMARSGMSGFGGNMFGLGGMVGPDGYPVAPMDPYLGQSGPAYTPYGGYTGPSNGPSTNYEYTPSNTPAVPVLQAEGDPRRGMFPTGYSPEEKSNPYDVEAIAHAIMMSESGGVANSKNPYADAAGLGAFMPDTWIATVRKHRPDLMNLPRNELLALRYDPEISKAMTIAHVGDNLDILQSHGYEPNARNAYMMHFKGVAGGPYMLGLPDETSLMGAIDSPNSPFSFSANTYANQNPLTLNGKSVRQFTVGDLKSWLDQKLEPHLQLPPPQAVTYPAPTLEELYAKLSPGNAMAPVVPPSSDPLVNLLSPEMQLDIATQGDFLNALAGR